MRPANDLWDERKIGEMRVIVRVTVFKKLYRQMLEQAVDVCQSIERWRFDAVAAIAKPPAPWGAKKSARVVIAVRFRGPQ